MPSRKSFPSHVLRRRMTVHQNLHHNPTTLSETEFNNLDATLRARIETKAPDRRYIK